jgi:hypothetical protein
MVVCGLLVPAHLRAVDDTVLEQAGKNTPNLIGQGLALAYEKNLGAAEQLCQAAQARKIPEREKLSAAIDILAQQNPDLKVLGAAEPGHLGALFQTKNSDKSEYVTEFIIRTENREKALELLDRSRNPVVQEVLKFRAVTNTMLFPPSQSASGQALDAALSLSGLLFEGKHLSSGFSNSVFTLAFQANRGGNTQLFEQTLMDLMSLGQRLNWGQLITFVSQIQDPETLRLQANLVRKTEAQLPILFSAVLLSANPSGVAKYLMTFGQTGFGDLGASLRFGMGGVNELLQRNQRLHVSLFEPWLVDWSLRTPGLAVTVKWIFYLLGGFLLAMALHFAWPAVSALEQPLQVRGFHLFREVLFALGFLLVVLLVSEPFLAQESQRADFPLRLRLPTLGNVVPTGTTGAHPSIMNNEVIITMLLFFVLQALLYVACLVKLGEVRRQKVPARIKLKLLENEEHLFDSGLYLGFLGTIISLILVSMGVFKQPSLMAAYSATSFGILFVVIFKILHLRPARRKILLEAEAASVESVAPTHSFAAPL